jgi:hypothetical protein
MDKEPVATRTGSAMLRRCLRKATSGQRRPVTSTVSMMVPSDPIFIEEGGTDEIDAATLTSKRVTPPPPPPPRPSSPSRQRLLFLRAATVDTFLLP